MPKGDAKEGYLNTNAHLEAKVALLMAQLAEGQAREAQLRHEVGLCYRMLLSEPDTKGALFKAENLLREALALPQDDSALREMIEAAKAEEREAIIAEMPGGHSVDPQWVCDMIRARGDK